LLSAALLLALSLGYVGILFGIAYFGDRRARRGVRGRSLGRALIYSLTLAVYCTSWTFYGAVGTAASSGWQFLPIYLGPVLVFIFGFDLLHRIVNISKRQNLTSIADFVAARYGRAHSIAVLVTVMAVIGTVPYIALQLKAVVMSYSVLTDGQNLPDDSGWASLALYAALALALFSILFGTRQLDATEHHRGMMLAIAFESVVKMLAFAAVGLYAIYGVFDGFGDMLARTVTDPRLSTTFSSDIGAATFLAQTVIAMAAILCLPRQFHVGVVECGGTSDLRVARWAFPLYLVVITAFVMPIALAGRLTFANPDINADTFVLALPAFYDQSLLSLLAFLGGFSAATGMVIVASVALATMVSNEIVLPLILRNQTRNNATGRDYSAVLLNTRRITIVLIALVAYTYYRLTAESSALASIGLLSFAAASQFAPPLVAGVYWAGANRGGAMSGLVAGFLVWAYTLLIPTLARSAGLDVGWIDSGPLGIDWLRPEALFGSGDWPAMAHGVFWSLAANIAALVIGSMTTRQSVREELQAVAFMDVPGRRAPGLSLRQQRLVTIGDLAALAERFIGAHNSERAFARYRVEHGLPRDSSAQAKPQLVQFTERLLAGSIGAASARVVMTTALRKTGMELGDVVTLLDQTSQALKFNRELLESTLENISQGVSVVDKDLRLVGWNKRYLELLRYPDGLVYLGKPVAELIQFNAERGLLGSGAVREEVRKRIEHMQKGHIYRHERIYEDDRVLEIRGKPMAGGGYVTTYTDITDYKNVETALRESERSVRLYTDNAPLMLAYVDREGRYRFANKSYLQFAGIPMQNIVGKRIEDVLTQRQLLQRTGYMEAALRGQRQDFELELEAADGSNFYALGTYIPEHDEDGNVLGFYGMFQDISGRRRAELALHDAKAELEQRVDERTKDLTHAMTALRAAKADAEQANVSKTRFLAAATHDLLQPLNAARLFTSVLSDQEDELELAHRRLVRQIDGSLGAAEDLLGALLDISKLDSDALVPEYEAVHLGELLPALREQFAPLAEERGLRIRVHVKNEVVRSDRQLLRRILQNLLVNAIRYTRDGGVLLGCRRRGDNVEIQVWDTGCGIAEHNLAAIFVEFHRIESAGSKDKGLGLGLAIVERIGGMLGHSIDVRSRPGRGSMFSVKVPAASESEKVTRPPVTTGYIAGARLEGARILCVDNQPEVLNGMAALLGRWGSVPLMAASLDEARKLFEGEDPPAAMLVDYHLDHGENGLDLMGELRAHWRSDIPGAVITADHSEELRLQAKTLGYPLLRKPVKPAALRATLDSLLRTRAAA
jgi:PAS domain S-box-containing protein